MTWTTEKPTKPGLYWLFIVLIVGCAKPNMFPGKDRAGFQRFVRIDEAIGEDDDDETMDAGLPDAGAAQDASPPAVAASPAASSGPCAELVRKEMEAAAACIVERNEATAQGKDCTDDGKVCPSCKIMNDASAQALAAGCHASR